MGAILKELVIVMFGRENDEFDNLERTLCQHNARMPSCAGKEIATRLFVQRPEIPMCLLSIKVCCT